VPVPRQAAVRERILEAALLELNADGGTGVQVVIDDQDATHGCLPAAFGDGVGGPRSKMRTAYPAIARRLLPRESVQYRISAANRPRCLPCMVYKVGSTTRRRRARDFKPNRIPRTAWLLRRDAQTPSWLRAASRLSHRSLLFALRNVHHALRMPSPAMAPLNTHRVAGNSRRLR